MTPLGGGNAPLQRMGEVKSAPPKTRTPGKQPPFNEEERGTRKAPRKGMGTKRHHTTEGGGRKQHHPKGRKRRHNHPEEDAITPNKDGKARSSQQHRPEGKMDEESKHHPKSGGSTTAPLHLQQIQNIVLILFLSLLLHLQNAQFSILVHLENAQFEWCCILKLLIFKRGATTNASTICFL